jgi:hypothetical protein
MYARYHFYKRIYTWNMCIHVNKRTVGRHIQTRIYNACMCIHTPNYWSCQLGSFHVWLLLHTSTSIQISQKKQLCMHAHEHTHMYACARAYTAKNKIHACICTSYTHTCAYRHTSVCAGVCAHMHTRASKTHYSSSRTKKRKR